VKLVYLAPADIQIARVDRQCIISFCAALQELGVDIELVALQIELLGAELKASRPLDLYRIPREFPVRLVRVPAHQESPSWWVGVNRLFVHLAVGAHRALRVDGRLVLYEKNHVPGLALTLLRRFLPARPLLVFEAHMLPRTRWQRLALRRADLIVANTYALAADLVADVGIDPSRVVGTHQGVDLESVEASRVDRMTARTQLGLTLDKKLAVYTGKIYFGYREVDHILEAAQLLQEEAQIEFVLVGGREDHVDRLRRRAAAAGIHNVTFTGFVPPTAVPVYQQAADVLLLYYPSGLELNKYRSPGKLFEYMASRRPIVAVDLPVLREVLGDEPSAMMIPPDSPRRLAEAIRVILDDPEEAERLAAAACRRVAAFTWEARARAVLAALDRVAEAGASSPRRAAGRAA
jgi:glycosyltransferase involved in cell wall biosynthesis